MSPVHEGTPVTWQILIGAVMKNEGRQRVCVDTGTSPNLPTGAAFGLLYLSAVIVVSLLMSNLPIGVGLNYPSAIIVVSSLVQLACRLSLLFEVVRTRMRERNN